MSLREDISKINKSYWHNDLVKIKPMETESELIYASFDCQLTDLQKEMVSPMWFIMGRAYLFKEDNYPCIIYNLNDEAIGFISFFKWKGIGEAYSWSYFIDLKHQGKGYGISSAKLAIDILKRSNANMMIKLATEKNNLKAQQIYCSLGFIKTDEIDGDDLVFVL